MIYFNNLFQNFCTVRETRQGNNPHAFLEIFRATAETCRWPKEWSLGLLLLQSGRAQAVALSLPTATRCRFAGVHRAIMDGLGLAQEGYRQRLWQGQMGLKDWTFTYARWLSVVAAWRGGSHHGAGGVGAIHCRAFSRDRRMGPLPPPSRHGRCCDPGWGLFSVQPGKAAELSWMVSGS